jgi:integral membrane protein
LSVAAENRALEVGQLRRLRRVSLAEATTLLLLLGIAVPLKHLAGWSAGVAVIGPLHGLIFLFYLWTALQTVSGGGWAGREIAGGFATQGLFRRKLDELKAGSAA